MANVKRIIRSPRSKAKKARDCRYSVVDENGETLVAKTYAEAVKLAVEVGGAAYMSCPVESSSGTRWSKTMIEE